MNTGLKFLWAGVVLLGFTQVTAQAQILSYSPAAGPVGEDGSGNETYSVSGPVTIIDPNATATDLTLASGFTPSNLTKYGYGYAFSVSSANEYKFAPDLASAITANDYVTFTVTPTSGYALNLTQLDFSTQSFESQNNGTPDTRYAYLESSVDGFNTTNILGTITINPDTTSPGTLIDFSSNPAFSHLTGSTEFRLYITDPTSTGQYEGIGLNSGSFTLNGTSVLAVPEPSTYAFLGLGLCLLLFARRARHSI